MEPELIMDQVFKCPVCKKDTFQAKDYVYDTPTGKLLLSYWECTACHYLYRDVKPYETGVPVEISLLVTSEEDLSSLVYRSAFAELYIPELGVEVIPGSSYQGAVSTIRGLLEIIMDNMGSLCKNKKCDKIRQAMDGKIQFTVIIKDSSGTSFIKNDKAKVTRPLYPSQ
ncbi:MULTISPECIES: ZPR1 zinc finger domain-containing protein [Metallosphaera]|uniref:ZPR1 zinc finger domain-containing protein n=1 Tax=Metallosphaera TaxID=41980 RepID=UPI001F058A03|nr:ZPR1 zinc finger domain-containing protein [Metallosphaera sedula]MCH1771639.1 ZPR1 zinc finger domain-containing protein [Metallosphaera sedula]MCP6728238.1 ZPR1 zinc finger domain-containing protein [Metallosphaera sedula]